MGSFIGNGILMSLNTKMPATILYPMVNGGIGVLVAIVSCTAFKEKLTVLKFLAILTGIASIIFLNL
jgi:multidrug transporter EmrE-like cation transporter